MLYSPNFIIFCYFDAKIGIILDLKSLHHLKAFSDNPGPFNFN